MSEETERDQDIVYKDAPLTVLFSGGIGIMMALVAVMVYDLGGGNVKVLAVAVSILLSGIFGWTMRHRRKDTAAVKVEQCTHAFNELEKLLRGHTMSHEVVPLGKRELAMELSHIGAMLTQIFEQTRSPDYRPPEARAANGEVKATPAARKLAEVHRLDLSKIPGGGKDGQVRIDDVREFVVEDEPQAELGGEEVEQAEE